MLGMLGALYGSSCQGADWHPGPQVRLNSPDSKTINVNFNLDVKGNSVVIGSADQGEASKPSTAPRKSQEERKPVRPANASHGKLNASAKQTPSSNERNECEPKGL